MHSKKIVAMNKIFFIKKVIFNYKRQKSENHFNCTQKKTRSMCDTTSLLKRILQFLTKTYILSKTITMPKINYLKNNNYIFY